MLEKSLDLYRQICTLETSPDYKTKLEEEHEALRLKNVDLKEEVNYLTAQLKEEDCYAELKADIQNLRAENNAIRERRAALQNEANTERLKIKTELPQDKLRREADQMRREIDVLRESFVETQKRYSDSARFENDCIKLQEELNTLAIQKLTWEDNLEELKSQKPQHNFEELYVQLTAARDQKREDVEQLQSEISDTIRKLAQESCWQKKCEAIKVSEAALDKENKLLSEHLAKLTKLYKKKLVNLKKHQESVAKYEDLKASNELKKQEIGKLEQDIVDLRAFEIRKLAKLKKSDVAIEKVKSNSYDVRQENCELCKQILMIENEIAQKKRAIAELPKLKYVERAVLQRREVLKKECAKLDEKSALVRDLRAENAKREVEIKNVHEENEAVQSRYEDLYVEVYGGEMLEMTKRRQTAELEEIQKRKNSAESELKLHEKAPTKCTQKTRHLSRKASQTYSKTDSKTDDPRVTLRHNAVPPADSKNTQSSTFLTYTSRATPASGRGHTCEWEEPVFPPL
ncbi:hypothetical protein WMY93_010078 [Mugilogobius chulae]|uniref:Uncharacterized protein n=1 Tax=Mugilogobius chulae TaxID=88201 RepID=A0AAW0PA02_9GOBI